MKKLLLLLVSLVIVFTIILPGCTDPLLLEKVSLIPNPVGAGNDVTLKIVTEPYADCTITVIYKSGESKAMGLEDKKADSSGYVSWTWLVGGRTTHGTWDIVVTASIGAKEAELEIDFTVN